MSDRSFMSASVQLLVFFTEHSLGLLEDGSMDKAFAFQVCEPELSLQHPHEKWYMKACTYNPSTSEEEVGESLRLVHQPVSKYQSLNSVI